MSVVHSSTRGICFPDSSDSVLFLGVVMLVCADLYVKVVRGTGVSMLSLKYC